MSANRKAIYLKPCLSDDDSESKHYFGGAMFSNLAPLDYGGVWPMIDCLGNPLHDIAQEGSDLLSSR
jgi:hypothetical protein